MTVCLVTLLSLGAAAVCAQEAEVEDRTPVPAESKPEAVEAASESEAEPVPDETASSAEMTADEIRDAEIDAKNEELITREEQEDWQRLAIGTIANEIEAMPAKAAKLFPELDRDVAQERLMSIAKEIWDNLYKRFNNIRKHPKIENETDSEREDSGLRPLVEGSGGHVQTAEPGSGECMGT